MTSYTAYSLAVDSILECGDGQTNPFSTAVDNSRGFLYLGFDTAPAIISKINLDSFTETDSLELETGETTAQDIVLDIANNIGYVVCATGLIVKIQLSDMTRLDVLDLSGSGVSGIMVDGFLYVTMNGTPSRVAKIDLSDFSLDTILTLNSGENNAAGLAEDGGFLYLPCYTAPVRVVKVRTSDMTRVGLVYTGASGEDNANFGPGICDGSLYVPLDAQPGKILKISLTDYSKEGILTLASGEDYSNTIRFDLSNDFGYVSCCNGSTGGRIVRIRLSDLTRIKGTVLSGECAERPSLDLVRNFVYVPIYYLDDVGPDHLDRVNIAPKIAALQPTVTFRVNLETGQILDSVQPYTRTEGDYFKTTRVAWFSDKVLANFELKDGNEFTVSGENATYLIRNYTTGSNPLLEIVS